MKAKYCIKCGKPLAEGFMLCPYCGAGVAEYEINQEALAKSAPAAPVRSAEQRPAVNRSTVKTSAASSSVTPVADKEKSRAVPVSRKTAVKQGPKKTCPSCGNQVPEKNKFCSSCGYRFEPAVTVKSEPSVDPVKPVTPAAPEPKKEEVPVFVPVQEEVVTEKPAEVIETPAAEPVPEVIEEIKEAPAAPAETVEEIMEVTEEPAAEISPEPQDGLSLDDLLNNLESYAEIPVEAEIPVVAEEIAEEPEIEIPDEVGEIAVEEEIPVVTEEIAEEIPEEPEVEIPEEIEEITVEEEIPVAAEEIAEEIPEEPEIEIPEEIEEIPVVAEEIIEEVPEEIEEEITIPAEEPEGI